VDGVSPRKCLPPANRDIDEAFFYFECKGASSYALGCQDCRSGTAECVKDDIAATCTVLDCITDESDWLHCWMGFEVIHSSGAKCIDARVMPNVGAGAAMAAKLDVVQVSGLSDSKYPDEFMLAAIE
jgi:hypothetical protein